MDEAGPPSNTRPTVEPNTTDDVETGVPLTRSVSGGVVWLMVGTVVQKLLSLVTLIVLGRILDPSEFGVYALAISVAAFVRIFRSGGVNELLVHQGREGWEKSAGPILWIGMATSIGAGIILAATAPVVANVYDEPRLVGLLLVIALSIPLATPGMFFQARMWVDLQADRVAKVQTVAALVRNVGIIGLALLGFGAMSWVIPMLAVAIIEWVLGWWMTRDRALLRSPSFEQWGVIFGRLKWIVVGGLGVALLNQGDYFVAGKYVTVETIGLYYFAYQLTAQVGVLLAHNLQRVLFPALNRLASDPERQRRAVIRTFRVLALAAAVGSVGVGVIAESLEMAIWHGKWEDSVVAIWILAAFFPFRLLLGVSDAMLMSLGKFRRWAVLSLAGGMGLAAAAYVGATNGQSAESIAAAVSVYLAVSSILNSWLASRVLGIGLWTLLRSVVPPWAVAVFVGVIIVWADHSYAESLPSWVRLIASGGLFTFIWMLMVRIVLRSRLQEMISAMPGRLSNIAATILFLHVEKTQSTDRAL